MTQLKELITLDPEELLTFFTGIKAKQDINMRFIAASLDHMPDNFRFEVNLNGYKYITFVYRELPETAGAFHFMSETQRAYYIAAEHVVKGLADWFDYAYRDYVRNDTGHNINNEFATLVLTEIERIANFFE